jgi:hypothetical protein
MLQRDFDAWVGPSHAVEEKFAAEFDGWRVGKSAAD